MKLSNSIERDWVRCELEAEDRASAFRGTIANLPDGLRSDVTSVLFDEEGDVTTGSFATGKGVAFPHVRTDRVDGIQTVIGLFPGGVEFQNDGAQRVRIVVLFLFSEKRSGLYLKLLSAFSSVFESDVHVENAAQCTSPQALISYLEATGSQVLGGFSLHDLVKPPQHVLRKGDTLEDALEALNDVRGNKVPVVDDEGRLLGSVRHAELIRLALRDYGMSVTNGGDTDLPDVFSRFVSLHGEDSVDSIMETEGVTIDESSTLFEATSKLIQREVNGAPVTSSGRLVGVFRLGELTEKMVHFSVL